MQISIKIQGGHKPHQPVEQADEAHVTFTFHVFPKRKGIRTEEAPPAS